MAEAIGWPHLHFMPCNNLLQNCYICTNQKLLFLLLLLFLVFTNSFQFSAQNNTNTKHNSIKTKYYSFLY